MVKSLSTDTCTPITWPQFWLLPSKKAFCPLLLLFFIMYLEHLLTRSGSGTGRIVKYDRFEPPALDASNTIEAPRPIDLDLMNDMAGVIFNTNDDNSKDAPEIDRNVSLSIYCSCSFVHVLCLLFNVLNVCSLSHL